jgi:hypothetical protein
MRSPLPGFHLCVAIAISIIFLGGAANAQEAPEPASGEAANSKSQFPAAKKEIPAVESPNVADDPDKGGKTESDKDSPYQIRKRAEWFYKQRSSVNWTQTCTVAIMLGDHSLSAANIVYGNYR